MAEAQQTPWTAPEGPLGRLTERSVERARAARTHWRALEDQAAALAPAPSFRAALDQPHVAVIAEIKRASPSKGVLDASLDAAERAAQYVAGGAAALSVLTEATEFGGSLDDVRAARAAVAVPLLRKDFVVDEVQLLEARAAGASAVLLIARALPPATLMALAAAARSWGLEPLIEVRGEHELEVALGAPNAIIGVNNRNLETLAINDAVSERLLPLIPAERIAVYESGVRTVDDVRRAAVLGADAVLVGSALSVAATATETVRQLASVTRVGRD